MPEPILYEQHMHTPLCKHARGEPEEYAAVAQQRGLKGIVVTCHNPTNDGWTPTVRMSVEEFDDYVALVERARTAWAGRVDVRLGIESDYVPGMEPWLEELHGRAELHHVIGSVHVLLGAYKERFYLSGFDEFVATYYEHLAMAAETGLFDTLGHPDLVKIESPEEWSFDRFSEVIGRNLDRIASAGTAMELNTSGLNKTYPEMNPGSEMLAAMREREIPVVIGADAHDPHRVGADFEQALQTLTEVGYTHVSNFLNRQRVSLSIAEVHASLTEPVTV